MYLLSAHFLSTLSMFFALSLYKIILPLLSIAITPSFIPSSIFRNTSLLNFSSPNVSNNFLQYSTASLIDSSLAVANTLSIPYCLAKEHAKPPPTITTSSFLSIYFTTLLLISYLDSNHSSVISVLMTFLQPT